MKVVSLGKLLGLPECVDCCGDCDMLFERISVWKKRREVQKETDTERERERGRERERERERESLVDSKNDARAHTHTHTRSPSLFSNRKP